MPIAIEPPKLKIPGIRMAGKQIVLTCQTLDGTAVSHDEITRLSEIIRLFFVGGAKQPMDGFFKIDVKENILTLEETKLTLFPSEDIEVFMRWLVANDYADKKIANDFLMSHKWTAIAKIAVYLVGLVTAGLLILSGAGSLLGYKSATSLLTKGFSFLAKNVVVDASIASAVAFLGGMLGWGAGRAYYQERIKGHHQFNKITETGSEYEAEEKCADVTIDGFKAIANKDNIQRLQIRVRKNDFAEWSDIEKAEFERVLREHLNTGYPGKTFTVDSVVKENIFGHRGPSLVLTISSDDHWRDNGLRVLANMFVGIGILPAARIGLALHNLQIATPNKDEEIFFVDQQWSYNAILATVGKDKNTHIAGSVSEAEYEKFLRDTKLAMHTEDSLLAPHSFVIWNQYEGGLTSTAFPMEKFEQVMVTSVGFEKEERDKEFFDFTESSERIYLYPIEKKVKNITFYNKDGKPIRMMEDPDMHDGFHGLYSWSSRYTAEGAQNNDVPSTIRFVFGTYKVFLISVEDIPTMIESINAAKNLFNITAYVYNAHNRLLETRQIGKSLRKSDIAWLEKLCPKKEEEAPEEVEDDGQKVSPR